MKEFKITFLIFLLIANTGYGQGNKLVQKFKLPLNISSAEYQAGVVWVKLKEKNKTLFDHSSSTSRKAVAKIKMHSAQPLINQKMVRNRTARSGPRKVNIDISCYYKIWYDSKRSIEDYINELYATGYFDVIEPVYTSKAMFIPNDPQNGSQYYLSLIKAYDAWDITKGDESIVIGIVDSGGDLDHPDIGSQLFNDPTEPIDGVDNDNDGYIDNNKGWDFSGADTLLINKPGFIGDNDPSITKGGYFSHGSWVAGCASAATDNGTGISGVGYKTKLLFTKHYADNQPSNATNYSSNTYDGILYAATHGAKIINCSWGSKNVSAVYQDIITYVTLELGCLVIAAAGNDGNTNPFYPASYEYVLSIANSDNNDKAAKYTSFGNNIDLTAPGVGIISTGFNDLYQSESGTSLSAPIVSGAAALVWAANPTYTPLQVGEQLRISADPIVYANSDPIKYNNKLGRGRLDIKKALTIESPSIRARNPLLVKNDGNPPDPGQSANVIFDFTNYLRSTSSALEISISSTSAYLTITKDLIRPGIIVQNTTIRNTLDPFIVTISSSTPFNSPIEVMLTFSDGTYIDTQTISFVIPSYIDINENNITTTLASNGRMGYEDPKNSANGSGFVYNDENILYEMGIIMGTSTTNLFNSARSINKTYDEDFTTSSKIIKITPGERSFSEVSGSFRNNVTAGSETINVSYRSLVWKDKPNNNFVILEYKVKNTTASLLSDFYFGIFADWDIALNGTGDHAAWNSDFKLGYVFAATPSNHPLSGIQSLTGSAQYFAIDNDEKIDPSTFGIYDGFTDEEKFRSISSGLGKTEAGNVTVGGNDVSQVVSSGPYSIHAGDEIVIAFALHGANTYSNLINSAAYADSMYNYTLKTAKPVVNQPVICYGGMATFMATGAARYNWYRDFTGGDPFNSGTTFITPNLVHDTTFYVSNAENTYESIRTSASVVLKANPTIMTSRTATLCEGETITLHVKDADEYFWSTGEKTQSIMVSSAGDYTVVVNDNTLNCNSTSAPIMVKVNAIPQAGFLITGELFSGDPILFTDQSNDAISWLWEFGDGNSSIEKNPSHQYTTGGDYSVKLIVTSSAGCQGEVSKVVDIITGLEVSVIPGLILYPNPVNNEKLFISLSENVNDTYEVSILNPQGQQVKRDSLSKSGENILSVSDLPSGIYYVQIRSTNKRFAMKIIIQR